MLCVVYAEERLLTFVEGILANPKTKDVQLPTGYSAVADELSSVVGSFLRLVSYNQAVFGSYYSDIVSSIVDSPVTVNAST